MRAVYVGALESIIRTLFALRWEPSRVDDQELMSIILVAVLIGDGRGEAEQGALFL